MSKFLSYNDRLDIEAGLKAKKTFMKIAKELNRDRTTIAKEVKRNSYVDDSGYGSFPFNVCKRRKHCRLRHVCGAGVNCTSNQMCKQCDKLCNRYCEEFEEVVCKARFNAPYACNGCSEVKKCTLEKTIYEARSANEKALDTLSESRRGIFSTEDEIIRINEIIFPLIKQGQSLHHIYLNFKDELMCSERTLYNYIEAGLFDVKNIDLPRKVRYRPRYKKPELKIDKGCRIGRNYKNFEEYLEKNRDISVTQMDSVIGTKGGKVLLTIYFTNSSVMLAFLRDGNTSKSVVDIFEELYENLGIADFRRLFQVILTDNGSEFSNPVAIEFGRDGSEELSFRRTRVYYCNPSAPYQKGEIEVGHEFIRRIIPKGKSFDELTQADVQKMMDHINSYRRDKLNGRSPYEMFEFFYGKELLSKIGCRPIAAKDIILKSALLKK